MSAISSPTRGHSPYSTAPTIQNLLNPHHNKDDSWVWRRVIQSTGVASSVGAAVTTIPGVRPVATTAAIAGVAGMVRKVQFAMIREAIDVLLVLERIYWYDGETVSDDYLSAACLYYLKRRSGVHDRVWERFKWILATPYYSYEKVEKGVEEIVEEFRFGKLSEEVSGKMEGI